MQIHLRKLGRVISPVTRRRTVAGVAAFSLAVLALVATSSPASASVSSDAGFEFADGNLAPQAPINFDWNSFSPTTWTGTSPYRVSAKTVSGWQFAGVEDDQAATADSAFAGGTKQDDDCATVISAKAPNKDDLKRVFLTTKIVNGSVFLGLAWVRIPQNTTSPSAHIGFEFNKATSGNCTGSGLVKRTAGDMLVVYDFEGGSGDPVLTLRRWITSGSCEVGSDTAPCWGQATNLSAAGFAEAKVNTTGSVIDTNTPPTSPATTSVSSTLGTKEFGEAGINLTAAGVFTAGQCESFGKAFAVSRSSGSSATAQMKDLAGPVNFTVANCGGITIRKVTENGDSSFGYTTTGGLSPSTFSLSNGGSQGFGTVATGSYSVTENLTAGQIAAGWTLKNLACTVSGTGTSATPSGSTVNITMAAGGNVDCTYTNHIKLSPTIATLLNGTSNSQTGFPGDSFFDTATLTGATANAGGTVTYTAYSDAACTQNPRDAGTKTVTNGVVPQSDSLVFNSTGTFYWQAVYSGDANNNGATSTCTDEVVTIGKNSPSITTKLNGDQPSISVVVGSSVYDTATLTGATADAGGTVTYTVYSDNACTQDARDAGTKTVTNGVVPDSNSLAFNDAGTFYWQAVYSGDTKNNGATSVCTAEVLTVTPKNPTGTTAQNLLPNDTFTLAGGFSATGTVSFKLFAPSDATCSGTPAYEQTVSLSGGTTAATTNASFLATDAGTWRWLVVYSGDNNNNGVTLACGVERFTIVNN